jgi:hypothetical protein
MSDPITVNNVDIGVGHVLIFWFIYAAIQGTVHTSVSICRPVVILHVRHKHLESYFKHMAANFFFNYVISLLHCASWNTSDCSGTGCVLDKWGSVPLGAEIFLFALSLG